MTIHRTGIEIRVGLSAGQEAIGKVLTALHLEKLGEWVAGMAEAVIRVDGVERVEPLYQAHFIEAAPGVHTVQMYMRGKGPSSDSLSSAMRGTELAVSVPEGGVVVLRYAPHDGVGATLAVIANPS
jgi:hypothetical protein